MASPRPLAPWTADANAWRCQCQLVRFEAQIKSQSQYFSIHSTMEFGIVQTHESTSVGHLKVSTTNATFIFSSSKAMGSPVNLSGFLLSLHRIVVVLSQMLSFRVGHGTWPECCTTAKWYHGITLQSIELCLLTLLCKRAAVASWKRTETKRQDRNETNET